MNLFNKLASFMYRSPWHFAFAIVITFLISFAVSGIIIAIVA